MNVPGCQKDLPRTSGRLDAWMMYRICVPERLHPRRIESCEIDREHVADTRLPGRWAVGRREDPVTRTCPETLLVFTKRRK